MYNLLLFLAAYLPFQIALNPVSGVDLASIRVLILVIFSGWLASSLGKREVILEANLKTGLIASFLFLNTLSLIVAKNIEWSWRKLLFLFSIFPVYFVVSAIIKSKKKMAIIIKTLIFSGVAISLIGIIQFFLQFFIGLDAVYSFWSDHVVGLFLGKEFSQAVLENPSWLVNIAGKTYLRATATFPDPHMLSFFLGLLTPWALMFAVGDKNKKRNILFLGILIIGNLLTFSRGGYLGIFVGAIVASIFLWLKISKTYKFIVVAIIGTGVLLFSVPNPVSLRFFSSFNLKEGSNKGRIETWTRAGNIIRENLWLGVGIGNYPLAVKPSATYREPIYAHNAYLDIAAETGLLNMLVWIGILGLAIKSFWNQSKRDSFFFGGVASVIIFMTHSLVETAIYSPTVLTLFLIIVGFSNIELAHEKNI